MQNRYLAFLDMDGVLVDFVGGVCAAHKRPMPWQCPEELGIFDMEKLWGMSAREFWAPTDGEGFWTGLAPTEECGAIVEACYRIFTPERVCILTAPSMSPWCVVEKREWVASNIGKSQSKRMLFGSAKEFVGGPGRVLVDDRDRNIDRWVEVGGHGVLVPRVWNSGHPDAAHVVEAVEFGLMKLGTEAD